MIVGVGWDMRSFRMKLPNGTRVYELDFCTTLAERSRRLAELGVADPPGIVRCQVPIDLRTMPLAPVLTDRLQPDVPVFIAWEGMSMYFQEQEVRHILEGMMPVLRHPDSLLWVDWVDRHAVEHPEDFPPSVANFMRGMQILGEPFTFGPSSIKEFMHSAGLRSLEIVPSDVCLHGREDPVYAIYKFCIAAPINGAATRFPNTFVRTRLDGNSHATPQMHAGCQDPRSAMGIGPTAHR